MLELIKKDEEDEAELRGADPVAALADLGRRLESVRDERDPKVRSEVLSLVEEAGAAHVTALLAQCLATPPKPSVLESAWKPLFTYVSGLTGALGSFATLLIRAAGKEESFRTRCAAAAARALRACRLLAKVCLVRYLSVPPKLWRLAYSVHADAENAGCATTPAFLSSAHKTATTATQEFVKLLMLQVSATEMMAPEQIEVVDRVIEQLGESFTLRPRDVTDNPFCFDPGGDLPPRRAVGPQPAPDAGARYFGAGMGFDALERIHRQLAAAKMADIRGFGKDIAAQAQVAAVEHLLLFWRADCPYSPPVHSQATGNLQVIHRYGQIWQQLFRARPGGGGLSLQADGDENPQPPETWALRDAGGNELGADIPQPSDGWARCGEIAAVSRGGEWWLGVIRRMHAEPGHGLHADIAVLSREPLAVSLRKLLTDGEDSVFSEASSRQFDFNEVRAIILADGSESTPNLLLAPDGWKEGRIYEATIGESPRYLRGLQVLRRGEDYVRATFEWVSAP